MKHIIIFFYFKLKYSRLFNITHIFMFLKVQLFFFYYYSNTMGQPHDKLERFKNL